MTTIANIAQRILEENGLTTNNFTGLTLTILEYKIDDAIDYVNAMAGTTIQPLGGSAETKSFTYTAPQNIAVKQLVNLMLTAYKQKGSQLGLGALNITYISADPNYKLAWEQVKTVIDRLKTPPLYVSNDPVQTE